MSTFPSANYAVPGLMPIPSQLQAVELYRKIPEDEVLRIDFFVGDTPPEKVHLVTAQGTCLFTGESKDFIMGPYHPNPAENCWTVEIPECHVPLGSSYLVFQEQLHPSSSAAKSHRVRVYRHDFQTAAIKLTA